MHKIKKYRSFYSKLFILSGIFFVLLSSIGVSIAKPFINKSLKDDLRLVAANDGGSCFVVRAAKNPSDTTGKTVIIDVAGFSNNYSSTKVTFVKLDVTNLSNAVNNNPQVTSIAPLNGLDYTAGVGINSSSLATINSYTPSGTLVLALEGRSGGANITMTNNSSSALYTGLLQITFADQINIDNLSYTLLSSSQIVVTENGDNVTKKIYQSKSDCDPGVFVSNTPEVTSSLTHTPTSTSTPTSTPASQGVTGSPLTGSPSPTTTQNISSTPNATTTEIARATLTQSARATLTAAAAATLTQAAQLSVTRSAALTLTAAPTLTNTPIPSPTLSPTPSNTPLPTATPLPTPTGAQIGDYIWKDSNANGIQDDEDISQPLATAQLFGCGSLENVLQTVSSSAKGKYLFVGLDAGCYKVKFAAPSGYRICDAKTRGSNSSIDSNPAIDGFTDDITLTQLEKNFTIDAALCEVKEKVDLEIAAVADHESLEVDEVVEYTLTLKNTSDREATNVKVKVKKDSKLQFQSSNVPNSSDGAFNTDDYIWTIGSVKPKDDAQIKLKFKSIAAGSISFEAEVYSATQSDPDSTPNNWNQSEDDYAKVAISSSSIASGTAGDTKGAFTDRLANAGVPTILSFFFGNGLIMAGLGIAKFSRKQEGNHDTTPILITQDPDPIDHS